MNIRRQSDPWFMWLMRFFCVGILVSIVWHWVWHFQHYSLWR